MPPRTPRRTLANRLAQYDEEDGPIYGVSSSPANAPGTRDTPSTSRKSTDNGNLNHLLGLRMPPRVVVGSGMAPPPVPRRSRGIRNSFNKEKYVNAQFRFVMKPTGNYTAHFADPDLIFPFPQILQVIVPTYSLLSVAQGRSDRTNSDTDQHTHDDDFGLKEGEKEAFKCPICLGKPVAGRMTKCGHIFCFPCIIHYFTLSDVPKSAKCPICGETIQEFLLKSVKWWNGKDQDPQSLSLDSRHASIDSNINGDHDFSTTGKTIELRLIQRPQMTTLALPRSPTWPSEIAPLNQAPWHFIPHVMSFSKFMLATSDYMLHELSRELEELRQERNSLKGDELGISFVDAAINKVREEVEKAKAELDTPVFRRMEKEAREGVVDVLDKWERRKDEREAREKRELERKREQDEGEVDVFSQGMDQLVEVESEAVAPASTSSLSAKAAAFVMSSGNTIAAPSTSAAPALASSSTSIVNKPNKRRPAVASTQSFFTPEDPAYYYYQAQDGSNVYLSPLDIKILLAHYKSYNAFPDIIRLKPESADEGTMNEELRRRCKYLAHLPLGTDVIFVEADLEDTLGKEAVSNFEVPLKRRRERKREKAKKEDRAKVKWEAQERERLPIGLQFGGKEANAGDEDFMWALERSNDEPRSHPSGVSPTTASLIAHMEARDANNNATALGTSPRPSSSPSNSIGIWGSPHNERSFASALHAPPGSRPRRDPELDDEMARAWMNFEESAAAARNGNGAVGGADEAAGGVKVGGKKGRKKVVLSMGGGGRRG